MQNSRRAIKDLFFKSFFVKNVEANQYFYQIKKKNLNEKTHKNEKNEKNALHFHKLYDTIQN